PWACCATSVASCGEGAGPGGANGDRPARSPPEPSDAGAGCGALAVRSAIFDRAYSFDAGTPATGGALILSSATSAVRSTCACCCTEVATTSATAAAPAIE